MIAFAFFITGGLIGILSWLYMVNFIPRLQQEIHEQYQELFPETTHLFQPEKASIQEKNCGHIFGCFFLFGMFSALLYLLLPHWHLSLWLMLIFSLLWVISYLDWQYQLISPTPCLWLFFLGVWGASWQFLGLSPQESVESAVIFFIIFYAIYHLAKRIYQKEALGRGDYWLALGLGAYLPLESLPLFLLLACGSGIFTALLLRKKVLPFGPFLCLAMIILWGISHTLP